MVQEARRDHGDRRQAIFNAFPAPRVRVRVTPSTIRAQHGDTATTQADEADDLRAARGILFIGLAGIALWALIGLAYGFIAR
jgi:hypothetical protein